MKRIINLIGLYIAVAFCYAVTAAIGHYFFSYNLLISSIWPASGVALGALLLYGKGLWPGIFLGSLVINSIMGLPTSLFIVGSIIAIVEPLICQLLIEKFIGIEKIYSNIKDFIKYCLAAGVTSLILTFILLSTIYFTKVAPLNHFPKEYLILWLSHLFSLMIFPFFIFDRHEKKEILKPRKIAEYFLYYIILFTLTYANFGGFFNQHNSSFSSYRYIITVLFVYAAFRFDPFDIALSTLIVSYLATYEVIYIPQSFKGLPFLGVTLWICLFTNINFFLSIIINLTVRSNRQMTQELTRLERLNLVGEMAAGLAHEIRNPITSVRGFLQILSSKNLDNSNYYNLMISELDSANAIITEYLLLAKDKLSVLKPGDLNQIIKTLYPLINSKALAKDNQLILNLGAIPLMNFEENEIKRLIINICKNALEAMDYYGTLLIETFTSDSNTVLRISDQGKGIPPSILAKVGTPFFTTKVNGIGLGLAICYSIAERHNATIKIQSTSDGTTFDIVFKNQGF